MPTVTYSRLTIRSQFQANGWTTGDQVLPDVLGLSGGGYVAAYNNTSAGFTLLTFYSAAGTQLGSYQVPYSSVSTEPVGPPSLTELTNGNVLVVWADIDSTDTSRDGIRGTIFTSTGTAVLTDFAITGFGTDRTPQVSALEGGGFAVTYDVGGDIFARVFNSAGTGVTSEFTVAGTTASETDPAITGLADGGFVVTWTNDNAGTINIMGRIFEANGTARTAAFVVGATGVNTQAAVAALPNGNFAVAYRDTGWGSGDPTGITLTIVNASGTIVNSFVHVNNDSVSQNESDPDITVLENGFILVTWTYPFSGTDNDIYARVFNQSGSPVSIDGSSAQFVIDASVSNDLFSAVSTIFSGRYIAGWQDSFSDGSGGRISATVEEIVRTTTGDGTNETLTGDALRDTINGAGGADIITGGLGVDTLTGGAGFDIFRDTAAGLNGDTITDFAPGDRIHITNATIAGFTYGYGAGTLAYTGGSLSTAITNEYRVIARAAEGGGVDLLLTNADYDFNGDGRSDLAWRNADGSFTSWLGQPNGSFTANPGSGANALDTSWRIVGVGDFNGDGRDDILWRHNGGEIGQWLGQSSGMFINNGGAAANAVDNSWAVVGIADYNGDGRDDILWRHTSGEVGQWVGQPSGGFANNGGAAANAVDPSWTVVANGDFNGDSRADVLWRHTSGVYAVWQGSASGALVNAGSATIGGGTVVGVGDFNGDGREDVLARASNGAIGLALGQANGTFTLFSPTSQVLDLNWRIAGIGDYNGDGRDDLVWRHTSGAGGEWLATGNGDFANNGAIPTVDPSWQIQSPDIWVV